MTPQKWNYCWLSMINDKIKKHATMRLNANEIIECTLGIFIDHCIGSISVSAASYDFLFQTKWILFSCSQATSCRATALRLGTPGFIKKLNVQKFLKYSFKYKLTLTEEDKTSRDTKYNSQNKSPVYCQTTNFAHTSKQAVIKQKEKQEKEKRLFSLAFSLPYKQLVMVQLKYIH